jgi:hypothetical protein
MISQIRIALEIPHPNKTDRYFSFRLKENLSIEASEYRRPKRIFVVSDIEGNFRNFYTLLMKQKIINKYFQWTFSDNHLVILGDCFDRGEHVIECLWLIYSLEERARKEGGYVHFILGNHEIMNMNGDWRYVHPKYAANTKSHRTHSALYNGNNELWNWLRTKNIVEKIGDILFVHGGIADHIVQFAPTISEINNIARPYYTCANEHFTDPLLSIIYNSSDSPFWYRGYYQNGITEQQIDSILTHFNVSAIVTGHTVVSQVSSYFNGKLVNVNTDHSIGNSEGLLISKHRFYRITAGGERIRLK